MDLTSDEKSMRFAVAILVAYTAGDLSKREAAKLFNKEPDWIQEKIERFREIASELADKELCE